MNVIKKKTLQAFWEAKANRGLKVKEPLLAWFKTCRKADWRSMAEVRRPYGSADPVQVRSGKTATVFNVAGNKIRVITLIDFNRRTMFVTHVLAHREYDTDEWKDDI